VFYIAYLNKVSYVEHQLAI